MLNAGGSFGGAKPKALIDIRGVQWLIKFFDNEPIDVPLQGQRRAFNPADYATARAPKRRSPFSR